MVYGSNPGSVAGGVVSPQRVVEDCIGAVFDDYSVHPTGAIFAKKKGYQLEIWPKKEDGQVTAWTYVFTDPAGNEAVSANTVSHVAVMIGRIQRWAWSL